jgi:SAM-dependent methyltransferase
MTTDNMPRVAQYWNTVAPNFDAIYSGEKSPVGRALDRWLRRDMYERFDWVMETAGDVRSKQIVDIGCGSGRFVSALAKRGAAHVTGVDVAPQMLKLARDLAAKEGVADACSFVHADVLHWETNERFDLAIAIGFWDYIANPLPRLRVIRRLTRGAFLSAWPRLWTWRTPVRKARLTALGCPVYFFQRENVHRLLREADFRVTAFDVVGKLYCVEARPI